MPIELLFLISYQYKNVAHQRKGVSPDADVLTDAGATTDEIIDTPHIYTKSQTKTHLF